MRMQTIGAAVALLAAGGCADSSAPVSAALTPVGAGGSTTVHIIFPCQMSDVLLPGIKGDYNIVVDEQIVGPITSCQHRIIALAPGKHTLSVAHKGFDFSNIFGGTPFNVPNGQFYLYARSDGNTNWFLYETSAGEGQRMIANLKKGA